MKRLAIMLLALPSLGCAAIPPEPPQADGLWSISITPKDKPDKIRTLQICLTNDPAYLARMQAAADKLRTAITFDNKITNEKRTATRWSYDFVRTLSSPGGATTINESGSHQIVFPDNKHRTDHEITTGTIGGMPVNIDQVTSSTWISSDCGDVKPLPIESLLPSRLP